MWVSKISGWSVTSRHTNPLSLPSLDIVDGVFRSKFQEKKEKIRVSTQSLSTLRKRLIAKQVHQRTLWVRLRYVRVSEYLAFLPRVSPKSPLEHLFKSVKVPFKKRSELTTKKIRRRSSEKGTPTAKDLFFFFFFFETISLHARLFSICVAFA